MQKFALDVYVQLDTDAIRRYLFEIRPYAQKSDSDSVRLFPRRKDIELREPHQYWFCVLFVVKPQSA